MSLGNPKPRQSLTLAWFTLPRVLGLIGIYMSVHWLYWGGMYQLGVSKRWIWSDHAWFWLKNGVSGGILAASIGMVLHRKWGGQVAFVTAAAYLGLIAILLVSTRLPNAKFKDVFDALRLVGVSHAIFSAILVVFLWIPLLRNEILEPEKFAPRPPGDNEKVNGKEKEDND